MAKNKFCFTKEWQTGQKLAALESHSRGIKNELVRILIARYSTVTKFKLDLQLLMVKLSFQAQVQFPHPFSPSHGLFRPICFVCNCSINNTSANQPMPTHQPIQVPGLVNQSVRETCISKGLIESLTMKCSWTIKTRPFLWRLKRKEKLFGWSHG